MIFIPILSVAFLFALTWACERYWPEPRAVPPGSTIGE